MHRGGQQGLDVEAMCKCGKSICISKKLNQPLDKKGCTRDTRERSCKEVRSHQNGSSLRGISVGGDDEEGKSIVVVTPDLGGKRA